MDDFGIDMFMEASESFDTPEFIPISYGRSETSRRSEYKSTNASISENQNSWAKKPRDTHNVYATALSVLYTLTPAILILDSHRKVVFANREAEELLEKGDVISEDSKGLIFCVDHVAQSFLLHYLVSQNTAEKSLYNDDDGSFLLPRVDGWPMVAMVGCDQLDSLPFDESGKIAAEGHITLMIRDPNGRNPEQSKKLVKYFGLSGAESCVVGELVEGNSTDEIARKRGVSVVTIRNQLKSAQNKMGVTRQSELVSMVLRYVS